MLKALCFLAPIVASVASSCAAQIVSDYKQWHAVSTCWEDNNGGRTLHHLQERSDSVTVKSCLDACDAGDFALGGVEFGNECWCGNSIQYNNRAASPAKCDKPCAGDGNNICGGADALNLYQNGRKKYTIGPASVLIRHFGGFHLTKCWRDDKFFLPGGQRLLPEHPTPALPHETLTVQKCIKACKKSGFNSAGLEWSQECFCGNVSQNTIDAEEAPLQECNMPCTGNAVQFCGGPQRMLIYVANKSGDDEDDDEDTRRR